MRTALIASPATGCLSLPFPAKSCGTHGFCGFSKFVRRSTNRQPNIKGIQWLA
jgi:hypothetical protein